MTGVPINIEQVGTVLVHPGLEASLAAPHHSHKSISILTRLFHGMLFFSKNSQSTFSKEAAFTFTISKDPKCSTITFLKSA